MTNSISTAEPSRLKIMEVTLRDGSYLINFGFTASDTAILCGELDRLGFEYIEVGHGIGLGASESGLGRAAETDESYLRAAAGAVRTAKWGCFCIPGIATLEHIDMAADHGMHFIRVGTNVGDVEQSRPYIERARRRGLYVTTNLMKSYASEPKAFAQQVRRSWEYGSQTVYIVDSAGGMLTEDLEHYFAAVRDVCDCPIGFHGHDNLGLGVANALRAAELGAAIIDTSMQGMGRSAGNTPTELFLLALARRGMAQMIDPIAVIDVSEQLVKPLITRSGLDSLDMVSGYAQFHSSYMHVIREFSGKYQVDPRRLIIELCRHDRENAPRDLVEKLAQKLAASGAGVYTARYRLDRYFGREQSSLEDAGMPG